MRKFFDGYLKEFVYGALDGTVTTFAIISGSAGANLDSTIVFILGISNVLADGFSMASSNYLSEKSHREQSEIQNSNESWEKINPSKKAFATFASFVLIGSIPLIPYVFNALFDLWAENTFFVSCIFTFAAFVLIGQVKALVVNKSGLLSALETLLVGGAAAAVAYSVGAFLERII
ncbi:hypothetical protein A3D42_01400 [Candidatus Nomurabacteria bacterium RIFCSPHIGHO2_02_FULL_41_18]|uniref:VIT family protein n=1 Tax=Candidatus Nomurabacteria bacterium RIFCSPHIGHO2_02_FULL_41_18 TaxID=1801754 RepID=A0A1F6W7I4_9BACT|nr:MAG: hypothetical protein A2737_00400 [Candidatus Nomurabacteria bacterium RIFCSPHIGHO2_01_FULL_41_71]OGI77849.1 MAG: hypothetical protein A3D42_01400 [Candidatus Nomurabacteria bacterium RIFCSPHIGHO2_02_FULL_41_18]OGI90047.1 MAG: hypothetical protein A3B01_02230 [Candidatus Nomurabacteria bacterium RIFCSPLOWO2_01_FULL_41_52b]